jgi:hypothetical protein
MKKFKYFLRDMFTITYRGILLGAVLIIVTELYSKLFKRNSA